MNIVGLVLVVLLTIPPPQHAAQRDEILEWIPVVVDGEVVNWNQEWEANNWHLRKIELMDTGEMYWMVFEQRHWRPIWKIRVDFCETTRRELICERRIYNVDA